MRPGPDPENSRDQDPDIVPGEPPVLIDDAWLKRRLNHKTQPVKIRLQKRTIFFSRTGSNRFLTSSGTDRHQPTKNDQMVLILQRKFIVDLQIEKNHVTFIYKI